MQLDIIVFGKRAGKYATERADKIEDAGNLSLYHAVLYNKEVEALGIEKRKTSTGTSSHYIPIMLKQNNLLTSIMEHYII